MVAYGSGKSCANLVVWALVLGVVGLLTFTLHKRFILCLGSMPRCSGISVLISSISCHRCYRTACFFVGYDCGFYLRSSVKV